MDAVGIANVALELGGVILVMVILLRLLQKCIGHFARKKRRRDRPKEEYSPQRREYRERPREYSGYREKRSYYGKRRWRKRYPEWERWDKQQTDYLGGMFHEIVIGGFKAVYCMDYYPKNKYPDSALSAEQLRARSFLIGVKDGRFADRSADIFAHYLLGHYWKEDLKKCAVCYIPAATQARTEQRYAEMSELVLAYTPVIDGRKWIQVMWDRESSRRTEKTDDTTRNLRFDREKIQGKRIFLVDDITTRGMSFVQCARRLKECGAEEVIGFFFGKSVHGE